MSSPNPLPHRSDMEEKAIRKFPFTLNNQTYVRIYQLSSQPSAFLKIQSSTGFPSRSRRAKEYPTN